MGRGLRFYLTDSKEYLKLFIIGTSVYVEKISPIYREASFKIGLSISLGFWSGTVELRI